MYNFKIGEVAVTMKKLFPIILCLVFLFLLISCGKPEKTFEMPEKTDKLVIYHSLDPEARRHFDIAVRLFRDIYPDVEVVLEDFGIHRYAYLEQMGGEQLWAEGVQTGEAYKTRLLTELMAGGGPDVFLFPEVGVFGDLEKTMSVDIFEDLNPYFEQDETFHYDDFVSGVFDAGVRGDRRLFVPLNYDVPVKLTSLEALERWNVEYSEDMSREEYEAVLRQVYTQIKEDDSRWLNSTDFGFGSYLDLHAGFRYIDYEKNEVVIDSAQLKEFMDIYGPFGLLYEERFQKGMKNPPFDQGSGYGSLLLEGSLFEASYDDFYLGGMNSITTDHYRLMMAEQTPVYHSLPRADDEKAIAHLGTCAAIGENSDNKANAYEFLKILLSDDVYVKEGIITPIPVRKDSAERLVADSVETFVRDETPREVWEGYIPKYLSVIWDVSAVHRNPDVIEMVEEAMTPYMEGTKPYEECFEELEERLNFYISE